jgi:16S rRNA (cytidine1402-2'-O)-methyltransferase
VLVIRGGTARDEESVDAVVRRARDYVSEGETPSRAAARAARESGLRRGEVYEHLVKNQ